MRRDAEEALREAEEARRECEETAAREAQAAAWREAGLRSELASWKALYQQMEEARRESDAREAAERGRCTELEQAKLALSEQLAAAHSPRTLDQPNLMPWARGSSVDQLIVLV